ncbi:MAG: hypothetical protein AAF125_11995 [Chloroflexota bacterium]
METSDYEVHIIVIEALFGRDGLPFLEALGIGEIGKYEAETWTGQRSYSCLRIPIDDLWTLVVIPSYRIPELIWSDLRNKWIGVITLCDSTDHAQLREVKSRSETIAAYVPEPQVFAVTHTNEPTSITPEDLKILLRLDDFDPVMPVIPCDLTDTVSVRAVLLRICEMALTAIRTDGL